MEMKAVTIYTYLHPIKIIIVKIYTQLKKNKH